MSNTPASGPDTADFGEVLDASTIRFVRDLPGPIERVWDYLTKAELTATWLYGNEIPQTVGEEFGSSWEGEGDEPGGAIRFRVRVYDPPRVLEYDWVDVPSPSGTITDSYVRFELEPVGDRVRLTLTQRALPAHAFQSVAAGWHAHLDVLRATLRGEDAPELNARYEAVQPYYAVAGHVRPAREEHSARLGSRDDAPSPHRHDRARRVARRMRRRRRSSSSSPTPTGPRTIAGTITEFSTGISTGSAPFGITQGPDGNLWFTEQAQNRIARITPSGGVTEFSTGITPGAGPAGITTGPDGNLWFTEANGDRIGTITTAGVATEYSGTIAADPYGIASGPDSNLWFTEQFVSANRIGRISTSGNVVEFTLGITPVSGPTAIVAGPDGNLWFTESTGNRIGRITPTGVVTEFTAGHQQRRAADRHLRGTGRQRLVHRVQRQPDRQDHHERRGDGILDGHQRRRATVRDRARTRRRTCGSPNRAATASRASRRAAR